VSYRITSLRDGRTFATRSLEAEQDGNLVLSMACSFTEDTEGYEYELPIGHDVPGPEEVEQGPGPGAWIAAGLGPTPPDDNGVMQSTHRLWFRLPGELPDDPHLHAALITFATDWTGIGGRPRHLEGDTTGMVSLDHAVWFHRPIRADAWNLYDVHSLVNAGGRGVLRGVMVDLDRHVAVSVAQEMLLRPIS
jgi:acyl-CoA thioesterase-2